MYQLRIILVVILAGGLRLNPLQAQTNDPVSSVKGFSDFPKLNLSSLLAGEILAERGSLMGFPNGISVQTCFVVPVTAGGTVKRLQGWDPSTHQDLKVFAYQSLHHPVELADFGKVTFKSNAYPVRWLRDKIVATTATKSELNLSHAEAQALASCVQKTADSGKVADCWANLLAGRASAFQARGYAGAAAYELGNENVLPGFQLRSMLQEQPAISREFAPILRQSGLFNGVTTNLGPVYYCNYFEADHKATSSLGAIYVLAVGDHYQVLDTEYYVSANYYTSAVLYEIWPIRVGDKTGALVWRGDFFAAPTLAVTKGTERVAYGALMLQEIKKSIRHFIEDVKATR
jgi:hypothetical protein